MAKRIVIFTTILSTVFSFTMAQYSHPNILLIVADDLGFSDLECYGGEIKTPNLDRLASNGLRFTQFYNCGRCWPSRASLLSGYYPQQIGRDSAPGIEMGPRPEWAKLLPEYLAKEGYVSYHSGKWHIDGMPLDNGFNHSYLIKDQDRYFNPEVHYIDDIKLSPASKDSNFYSTIEIANQAIKQLKEHHDICSEKPFFSYVAFTAPHFPLQALQKDIKKVGNRYDEGWEVVRQKRWGKILKKKIVTVGDLSIPERQLGPPYCFPEAFEILGNAEVNRPIPWDSLTFGQKQFQQNKMRIHAAMVERMDHEIGRIISQIKKMDVLDNTLIIFLSDNGASAEIMIRGDGHNRNAEYGSSDSYLCLGPGWSTVCNTPFRRHKTWVHEGGICTPFIVHWPDGIYSKGELRHTPAHIIDVVPTVFELVGISDKDNRVPLPGKAITTLFEGDKKREHPLWWYHEGNRAYRSGKWKIVAAKGQKWELYNLDEDRSESNDLTSHNPVVAEELIKSWSKVLEEFRFINAKN